MSDDRDSSSHASFEEGRDKPSSLLDDVDLPQSEVINLCKFEFSLNQVLI